MGYPMLPGLQTGALPLASAAPDLILGDVDYSGALCGPVTGGEPIPEPGTLLLLVTGLTGLPVLLRRRSKEQ